MYERLTECFQLYKRVVLADEDETSGTTAATSDRGTVESMVQGSPFSFLWSKVSQNSSTTAATRERVEEGDSKTAQMTALAHEISTMISRSDDDFSVNLNGLIDEEEEEDDNVESFGSSGESIGEAAEGS